MRSQCSGYLEHVGKSVVRPLLFFFFFFSSGFQRFRKLLMFLSRLYVSGGCEKIVAVSGSFWSCLKFLEMMFLIGFSATKI